MYTTPRPHPGSRPAVVCRYAQERGFCSRKLSGECTFAHPPACPATTQCPNLNCVLIHPNDKCHFDARCTSYDCQFRHPLTRPRLCKYGGICSNLHCPYLHPPQQAQAAGHGTIPGHGTLPCRFGSKCSKQAHGCPYVHPVVTSVLNTAPPSPLWRPPAQPPPPSPSVSPSPGVPSVSEQERSGMCSVEGVPHAVLQYIHSRNQDHTRLLAYSSSASSRVPNDVSAIKVNHENRSLYTWALFAGAEAAKLKIAELISSTKAALAEQAKEELVEGEVRALFGLGGEILTLLFGTQHISVNVHKVPSEWTELMLRAMCGEYGDIRSCVLAPEVGLDYIAPHPTQFGHVVFDTAATAQRALAGLQAEVGKTSQLTFAPGGIRLPSVSRDITGHICAYFFTKADDVRAFVSFSSAQDANKLLSSYTFKAFPRGRLPREKGDPLMPLLTSDGRAFNDKIAQKAPLYTVLIKGLSADASEDSICQRISLFNNTKHASVKIKRRPSANLSARAKDDAQRTLLEEVADLHEHIPYCHKASHRLSFVEGKKCKAGIRVHFSDADEAVQAWEHIRRQPVLPQRRSGSPLVLELVLQCDIVIAAAVWSYCEGVIEDILVGVAVEGKVTIKKDTRNANRTVLRLTSSNMVALTATKHLLETTLHHTTYSNPHKQLLFTMVGRRHLDPLLASNPYVILDASNLVIRIYSSPHMQALAIQKLDAIVATLKGLVLDHVIFIKPEFKAQVKDSVADMKIKGRLDDLRMFGRKILASGPPAAIDALKIALDTKIATTTTGSTSQGGGGGGCSLCFCTVEELEEPYTIMACQHTFCKECIGAMFEQPTVSIPVRCPACPLTSVPLCLADIVSVSSAASWGRLKQQALSVYLANHPEHAMWCPRPGCQQVLMVRAPLSEADERRSGGAACLCDACHAWYCASCSVGQARPVPRHKGLSCASYMKAGTTEEESGAVLQHRNVIYDICTVKCPRCKQAFFDFDGCFALQCSSSNCQARFCGFCLRVGPDSSENHRHVRECPLNPSKGNYHSTLAVFEAIRRTEREKAIKDHLASIQDRELRERLLVGVETHLVDLGIKISLDRI
eukprot:TRINITY_DN1845_c0_g1_i1.p1 TRINITY_DN1845_c0_g1~~TRINITY_DN1845_c0_g1_i1.p1  ORF type:complete len:1083 (+),score=180.97 TRINITY_DN1845_c0_g1_i1:61-3309(+)